MDLYLWVKHDHLVLQTPLKAKQKGEHGQDSAVLSFPTTTQLLVQLLGGLERVTGHWLAKPAELSNVAELFLEVGARGKGPLLRFTTSWGLNLSKLTTASVCQIQFHKRNLPSVLRTVSSQPGQVAALPTPETTTKPGPGLGPVHFRGLRDLHHRLQLCSESEQQQQQREREQEQRTHWRLCSGRLVASPEGLSACAYTHTAAFFPLFLVLYTFPPRLAACSLSPSRAEPRQSEPCRVVPRRPREAAAAGRGGRSQPGCVGKF